MAAISVEAQTLEFAKIPITALRQRGRQILSQLLNPVKILPSEDGFPRDWRGVAHLAGLQSLYRPAITAEADPMGKILKLWCSDGDNQTANFDNLSKVLGAIDRWDVVDDIFECFVEDAKAYESTKHRTTNSLALESDQTVDNEKYEEIKSDVNILTKDDVIRAAKGLPPQQYDAFVLFADEDIDFAAQLIERMEEETSAFNFKLCVKDRDLIGGISFEHEAIMRLISERCNRLIVIISAAFLKSPANTFFVNFAQALQIEQRRRKIVPCLYENCVLPPTLNFYFLLKYQHSGKLFNFWDKLADSVRSTTNYTERSSLRAIEPPGITITEVDSTTQQSLALPPIKTSSIPVKIPRKKNSKSESAHDMKALKSDPFHSSAIDETVEESKMHELVTNPPIRSAFSMIQLNMSKKDSLDAQGSLSSIPESVKAKSSQNKTKWYKKLLLPSISNSSIPETVKSTDAGDTEQLKKVKKKWFKRRLITS